MHAQAAAEALPMSGTQDGRVVAAGQLIRQATGGDHDPALVDALAQLDPAYRLPVLLHYYADLPLEQVALSLNVSVPAIKSRLHRARALLRNSLAESEEAGNQ